MFNFTAICESVKRHWIAILLVTVLALAAGICSSFVKSGKIETEPTYTAEASLYVTGYGYDEDSREGGDYNYQFSESSMINDVRRIVVSKEVAAQIREQYGENITIASPDWKNVEAKTAWSTRFCFIDVTADDPDLAVQVADDVAGKVCAIAKNTVPLNNVEVFDAAMLKTTDDSMAADWGTDVLESNDSSLSAGGRVSVKTLVIYGFVGLCLSVFCFAVYDIVSRRVRSANDAERLLDIPVLATLAPGQKNAVLSEDIRVLMNRNKLNSLAIAGATKEDGALGVANLLDGIKITGAFDLSNDVEGISAIASSDTVLLVVKEGASSGKQIDNALKQIKISGTPVLGVVFVSKK